MKVLLVGTGQYFHMGAFFRKALESLGYDYIFVDDWKYVAALNGSRVQKLVHRISGRLPTYGALNREILLAARSLKPDVVLITKGTDILPQTLQEIKRKNRTILINFATDDPLNPKASSRDLLAGIPCYDIYVCTKRAIMDDVRRAGCPCVTYVPFGYEPSLHYPETPTTDAECERLKSDVLFIGAADADRFPILRDVAAIPGVRLHLYGGYWDRDPVLKPYYRGLVFGRDYRLALNGTKIAICLVRRANRDGHVMRTFETPACGAFMLAERTDEHMSFFAEGEEMACFGTNEELVDKIRYYLTHDAERQRIARAGFEKVISGKNTYRDRLQEILAQAEALR